MGSSGPVGMRCVDPCGGGIAWDQGLGGVGIFLKHEESNGKQNETRTGLLYFYVDMYTHTYIYIYIYVYMGVRRN